MEDEIPVAQNQSIQIQQSVSLVATAQLLGGAYNATWNTGDTGDCNKTAKTKRAISANVTVCDTSYLPGQSGEGLEGRQSRCISSICLSPPLLLLRLVPSSSCSWLSPVSDGWESLFTVSHADIHRCTDSQTDTHPRMLSVTICTYRTLILVATLQAMQACELIGSASPHLGVFPRESAYRDP